MCTLLCFAQIVLGTTNHHIHTVLNEVSHHIVEIEELWTTLHKCNAVHREARLEGSIFVELIEHYLRIRITFDLNDYTHIAFGLVTNTRDTLDLLIINQVSDILYEIRLHYAIWQLANHDTLATIVLGFNLCFGADDNTSTTCLIGITYTLVAIDSTTCWEVRRFDMLHEFCHSDRLYLWVLHASYRVLHICDTTVNHLAQVVCRHIGSHTHSNTTCTINKQVREAARQNNRLFERVVEVELHIHGIFLNIAEHLLSQFREARLRITHSRSTITVNRTEVTLTIHQHTTHVPWLRHTNESSIDTAISVWVVLTHYLTDDTCGFLSRFIAGVSQLIHSEEHTAVNRLEAVTHIWQSTCHDDTHRIVDVRGSHFLVNLHRNNSVVVNHLFLSFKSFKVSRPMGCF